MTILHKASCEKRQAAEAEGKYPLPVSWISMGNRAAEIRSEERRNHLPECNVSKYFPVIMISQTCKECCCVVFTSLKKVLVVLTPTGGVAKPRLAKVHRFVPTGKINIYRLLEVFVFVVSSWQLIIQVHVLI